MLIDLEQGSLEWLEFRQNKIGASDAPIIMEVSPWKTPYELWQEKKLKKDTEIRKKTVAMDRGTNLEPVARKKYEEIIGLEMKPCVKVHNYFEYMIASLDGLSLDNRKAVEIKCPGKIDHETALAGEIPKKYYPQLQHIIAVCDLEEIDYFSFDGEEGVIVKCYRDDGYIENMIEKEREFFKCMITLTPPNLIKKDYNKIKSEAEITGALISISNVWV